MTQRQDQINAGDVFSAVRRILNGDTDDVSASVARLASIAAGRPQPTDVFPPRLGLEYLLLFPDWDAERLIVRGGLYEGACPVCDGRGYYMPRGEGHIDAERPCRCRDLQRLVERVESVGVPADLHRATPTETNWAAWDAGTYGRIVESRDALIDHHSDLGEGARSVILEGPTGSGKSHLAALLALNASAEGRSVRWLYWPDLIELVSSEFASKRAGAGIDAIYNRLVRPFEIVVLDDLGAGRTPPWIEQMWDGIVGRRSTMKRTIIATTNLREEQIRKAAGARAASRLYGHTDTITVNGRDQRQGGEQ